MQRRARTVIQSSIFIFLTVPMLLLYQNCSKSKADSETTPAVEVTQAQRAAAAATTATTNSYCTAIFPFYWEIGNVSEVLASGSTGDGSIVRTTTYGVASASKWMFGAYVLEKLSGVLDATTEKFLKMSAGYTSFATASCIAQTTVLDCLNYANNGDYTDANNNKFYYGGGHFQKWAVDNGMGSYTKSQLATEYRNTFGTDIVLNFGSTQLAGGVQTSAQYYALFLQKILAGQLRMKDFLGANPTCTLPSACADAVSSPIPEAFHYSYGHWIEDDPTTGDGTFSSAGLFGFYPWIDSTKTYYGILSRYQIPSGGGEIGSGWPSVQCGRLIRKAYMTGVAQ